MSMLHRVLIHHLSCKYAAQVRLDRPRKRSKNGSPRGTPGRLGRTAPEKAEMHRTAAGKAVYDPILPFRTTFLRIISHVTYGAFIGYYRLEEHLNHPLSRYPFCTATKETTSLVPEARAQGTDRCDRPFWSATHTRQSDGRSSSAHSYFFFEATIPHLGALQQHSRRTQWR